MQVNFVFYQIFAYFPHFWFFMQIENIPILGESPAFLDLLERVGELAPVERPVLVIGERGTGKELVGARLHFLSRRWERNFVQLNCAALPESLLEAELFGVEPGAFTGAQRRRPGRFELADGGTLFLDEIATLSPAAQEKLLRVIEYGRYERLGGSETLEVDVRVIGATHGDLPAMVERGEFRADLLDRLAFDVLTVPPLRARGEDILLLATHFARTMALELGWSGFPGFSEAAQAELVANPWPGNVRELRNAVERSICRWRQPGSPVDRLLLDPFESPWRPAAPASAKSTIASPAAGSIPRLPDLPCDLRAEMAAIEAGWLGDALATHRYNRRATAKALGLSYDQLRHAIKRLGLPEAPAEDR